jgi:hypothetical protein
MLFALASSGDVVLFLMIVVPLAIMGCRKFGDWIDPKGEIKERTKQGVLGMLGRWLK